MSITARSLNDIERDIVSKRRERALYVSPQGVTKCHAELDALLYEWEEACAVGSQPATEPQVPHA